MRRRLVAVFGTVVYAVQQLAQALDVRDIAVAVEYR
jgi:hypothetical protein